MTKTRTRRRTRSVGINGTELGSLVGEIETAMGTGTMRMARAIPGFNYFSTGVFLLDYGLLGGVPEGLVTMLYGWEGSMKTTLAMRCMAGMQRKYPDKFGVFIDAEQSFDPSWAEKHGVDLDRLVLAQPGSGEQAVDILEAVLRAQETGLVILDSLPALVPQAEADNSAEDVLVAARARLIGRACSKIYFAQQAARQRGNFPTTILINQLRKKIGGSKYGSPNVLPGGTQPNYLAVTKVEIKKMKEHVGKDNHGIDLVSHNDHAFDIKKSKVGNSIRQGEFTLVRSEFYRAGLPEGTVADAHTIASYAKKCGLITGGGASWYINNVSTKFGRLSEIEDYLYSDPDNYANLARAVIGMRREEMGIGALPPDTFLHGWQGQQQRQRVRI